MRISAVFLTMLLAGYVQAYDGWSGENLVTSIRVFPNASVYITMPGADNPSECDNPVYLILRDADTESGKRQYSALLSAYAAGKPVTLALTGCSGGGTVGRPLIEQVWIR